MSASAPILRAGRSTAANDALALARIPLFDGIPELELERVAHFLAPFEADPGEVLFRQGDEGDRVYLIERGRVETVVELTAGQLGTMDAAGPGEIVGEVSLMGAAKRSATVLVAEPVTGWVLHRSSFQMLRMDAGEGSVELSARLAELVLARLRRRFTVIAEELAREDADPGPRPAAEASAARPAEPPPTAYLETLLCFGHFHEPAQLESALQDAVALELASGAVAIAPDAPADALLIVLRGALDVSIRREHSARRVRLAGPGRMVGHLGALDGQPSPVLAYAREPVVLMAIPARTVRAMLRDPRAPARRFCAGLADDIGRALLAAERPSGRMLTDQFG